MMDWLTFHPLYGFCVNRVACLNDLLVLSCSSYSLAFRFSFARSGIQCNTLKEVVFIFFRRCGIRSSSHIFGAGHQIGVHDTVVGSCFLFLNGLHLGRLFLFRQFFIFPLFLLLNFTKALRLFGAQIRIQFLFGLFQSSHNGIVLFHGHSFHIFRSVVADLSFHHVVGLFEVLPSCVNDIDGRLLAPLNAISLDQGSAIQQKIIANVIQGHVGFHAKVNVGTAQIIHMEPNIFRPSVLDQIFILVLVTAHVEGVFPTAALEV
mmetsp:Transcript_13716/g.28328  ORF Transcript_13716/g.28328 Transcript_13716/m.28328 type:complete len:262 (+) Transcript_13716:1670-2455(+)